jgi:hypothetical protein
LVARFQGAPYSPFSAIYLSIASIKKQEPVFMGQRASDHPFHVEAFPVLDLQKARKQAQLGQESIAWRNQHGELVGIGSVDFVAPDRVWVEVQFRKLEYIPGHRTASDIACTIVVRPEHVDVLTSCSGCTKMVRKLVYKDAIWRCMACQRLAYRSTILTASVARAEELARLDLELAGGRPRFMHKAAYEKKQARRAWLAQMLGDARPQAPVHQAWLLHATWNTPPPVLPAAITKPRSSKGAWVGFDGLELLGEPLFKGGSLDATVERIVRDDVLRLYAQAEKKGSWERALKVRRKFAGLNVLPVPVLDDAAQWEVDGYGAARLQAQVAVPFTGAASMFTTGLSTPPPQGFPYGWIEGQQLILAARYDDRGEPFVSELLRSELELIQRCLEQLRRDADDAVRTFPARLKRIVDEVWPAPPRRKPPA